MTSSGNLKAAFPDVPGTVYRQREVRMANAVEVIGSQARVRRGALLCFTFFESWIVNRWPGGSGTFVHASVDSTKFYYELNEKPATSCTLIWTRNGYQKTVENATVGTPSKNDNVNYLTGCTISRLAAGRPIHPRAVVTVWAPSGNTVSKRWPKPTFDFILFQA